MNPRNNLLVSNLMKRVAERLPESYAEPAREELQKLLDNETTSLTVNERRRIQRVLEIACRSRTSNNAQYISQAAKAPVDQLRSRRPLDKILWPKISIVTPTYNQGHFIEDTILSIKNQLYPNLEFVIIDGGSSDDTLEVLERYKDFVSVLISEPDNGQSHAINKGMRLTTGEILYWLNSDDILDSNTLVHVGLCYLQTHFDLLVGTCTPFDNDLGKLNNRHIATMPFGLRFEDIIDIKSTWLKGMYFHQPEVFFSRRLWEAAGGYVDEGLHYSMDYDLWARMSQTSDFPLKLITSGKNFCFYREHKNQKTSSVDCYLPELLSHSTTLRNRHSRRPYKSIFFAEKEYRQKLSIIAISDFGFNGGAGIAHKRICQVLQAAGHKIIQLSGFQEWQSETINQPIDNFKRAIDILKPDLVLLGNLHNLNRGLDIAEYSTRSFPTIAIAHDFWWLTGRCAYTNGCHYLFTQCTKICPTPHEYPRLDPLEINAHHQRKKQLLQCPNFYVLANSLYTQSIFTEALNEWGMQGNPIGVVSLPVVPEGDLTLKLPSNMQKKSRNYEVTCNIRIVIGCTDHADFRKGSDLIALVLQRLMAKHPEILIDVYGKSSDILLASLPEYSNRIFLHGYLTSQEQYHDLLESADIFLGASREETLGQTFVEAAHAGLITVGPMQSGYSDVVRCCLYSLGYNNMDVSHIVTTVETALTLIKSTNPNLIRCVQRAQAQSGFSGMSFLSGFNHHLYSSGLWKQLSYHGPTKIFNTNYSTDQVEELVLAEFKPYRSEIVSDNQVADQIVVLTVDQLSLGWGLYPEVINQGTVVWLNKESSLIIDSRGLNRIISLSLLLHWMPDEMSQSIATISICGLGEVSSTLPVKGGREICFTISDIKNNSNSAPPKLLASLRFSNSFSLPDGRSGLAVILKAIELKGKTY